MGNPPATPPAQKQEPLYLRIWRVVRNILISSVLFWYVSQPLFVAGMLFGAVFYKKSGAFAQNIFIWWEMTGWLKRLASIVFGLVALPFLAKFGTFLWAAYLASDELTHALEQKQTQKTNS